MSLLDKETIFCNGARWKKEVHEIATAFLSTCRNSRRESVKKQKSNPKKNHDGTWPKCIKDGDKR